MCVLPGANFTVQFNSSYSLIKARFKSLVIAQSTIDLSSQIETRESQSSIFSTIFTRLKNVDMDYVGDLEVSS